MKIDKISASSFGPGTLIRIHAHALGFTGAEFLIDSFVISGKHKGGISVSGVFQDGNYTDTPAIISISRTGKFSLEFAPNNSAT